MNSFISKNLLLAVVSGWCFCHFLYYFSMHLLIFPPQMLYLTFKHKCHMNWRDASDNFFVQLNLQFYTLALLTAAVRDDSHRVGVSFSFVPQFRMRYLIYLPTERAAAPSGVWAN